MDVARPFSKVLVPELVMESEPELSDGSIGTNSPTGSACQDLGSFRVFRRHRRCLTEPSPNFLEFLRDQPGSPGSSTQGDGGEAAGESTANAGESEMPVAKIPSRTPSHRSLRSRRSNSSPFKQQRRRQLRFKLDTSPLRLRQVRRPPPTLRERLAKGATAVSKGLAAGAFGFTTTWSAFAVVVWVAQGNRPLLQDQLIIDFDGDGRWSTLEVLMRLAVSCPLFFLGLVLAKVALTVYYYTWLGLQAIRKNRRAVELQKTSPFFLSRASSSSNVDDSLLEYLQANYDFGPVPTILPATPSSPASSGMTLDEAAGNSDVSPAGDSRHSGRSVGSRRLSRRRFRAILTPIKSGKPGVLRGDTLKSASEYMSLEASQDSADDAQPPGMASAAGTLDGSEGREEAPDKMMVSTTSDEHAEMSERPSFMDNAKLLELVCKLSDWNFDIFEVAEHTPRVLAFIGFVCLDAYSKFVDFDKPKLVEFLRAVESSYRQVPYHNSLHGASVARCVYSFCAGCGLSFTQEYMEFTIVLAGLVHDIHHPGLTASFLSKASTTDDWVSPISPPLEPADMELSLKYNDQSPLENMHCAITFELLRSEKTAFLSKDEVMTMRKPLLRAILGTDMAKHAETMTRLAALIDNLKHDNESGFVSWHWPAKPPATADEARREIWERLCQEDFVMELFLHAADIGNPTLPFNQWVRWNRLVQEEFHLQGDRELQEFGEFISPPAGFDRTSSSKAEHAFTKGFMQYLSLPLFQQLHILTQVNSRKSVCQGVNIAVCLENLKNNIEKWEDYIPKLDFQSKEERPSSRTVSDDDS